MTNPQSSSDAGLATSLRISISRLARRLRAERVAQGLQPELTDTQLAALAALEKHTSMTPGELAEHEKVQPPSITRVIASLEERGLIRRLPHPTDRRQVELQVTDQGREVVRQLRQLREAWLARRLEDLSPAERTVLREALPILEKLSQS
ncbi:MAG TPA: MarR family transcriptional regulator [Streptosporangiaceae bacterium]|nr:MarR family transcriptional regulator [Streptosporangiaceae bacterium]